MSSKLESKFLLYWQGLKGPALEREHRFHKERRWRFDFAHLPTLTAYEIEGGLWSGGRHTRGAGFEGDAEKYLAAYYEGWRVVRLTAKQITVPVIDRLINRLRQTSESGSFRAERMRVKTP